MTSLESGTTGVEPDEVRRAISRRAGEIARKELDRAVERLEARGELTDDQLTAVVELTAAITAGVLAGPQAALERADEHDPETVRTAIELFGGDR